MKFVFLILCEKFKMAKRAGAENQFCVLPRKSIKLLAERVGISNLSSEVAASLAEDASYRIRQSVQSANQFVKHSKRDYMTGDDINRALFWSRVEPIYGYGSKNSNIFSSVSTKDDDLFFHEDKEINLRELAFSKGFSSLNDVGSCGMDVEVSIVVTKSASKSNSQSDMQPTSTKQPEFESLNPVLKSYYDQVTRNIIAADNKTVKVILDDFKTNEKIQVLLPYLVNFITTAMQTLSEDTPKLLRVFHLVKALIDNKHLYLQPYVVELVGAVMYCLVEKPLLKISTSLLDDWILRNRAAQCLCHIDRKCNNAANFLHLQLLRTFKDIYHASDRPLHCQYGAVTGIAMLGADAIEQTIFPRFKEYSDSLVGLLNSGPSSGILIEILHILEILKTCTIAVLRNKLKTVATISEKEHLHRSRGGLHKTPTSSTDSAYKSCITEMKQWSKNLPEWYKQVYDVLGDAFALFLGNVEDYENFTQTKQVPGNQTRSSMLNQARLQYVRKMIKTASDSRQQEAPSSFAFSLQGERARRSHELSVETKMDQGSSAYRNGDFMDTEDSESRFENLQENSAKLSRSGDFRNRTVRLPCLVQKRTPFRNTIALLTLPF